MLSGMLGCCATAGSWAVYLSPSWTEADHLLSPGASCTRWLSLPGPGNIVCVQGGWVCVWHPLLCVSTLSVSVCLFVKLGLAYLLSWIISPPPPAHSVTSLTLAGSDRVSFLSVALPPSGWCLFLPILWRVLMSGVTSKPKKE